MSHEGLMVQEERPQQWLLAHDTFREVYEAAELRFNRFLGNVAIRGSGMVEVSGEEPNPSTLLSAIQEAALGDETARRVVTNNAHTDVLERLFKAGLKTTAELQRYNGSLMQDRRKMIDLQRNTLEHTVLIPEMLDRSKAEARNLFVFEGLAELDVLDTHYALVISPASTKMTAKEKADYHIFGDTESCSMQLLGVEGDKAELQTALVAGKRRPDAERHDIQAIQTMTAEFGMPITSSDSTDILRQVILIPKEQLSNGIDDVVAAYDRASGGTFYGLDQPVQDYQSYSELCQERQDNLKDMVEEIVEQLIKDAPAFETPMDAILRLDELSSRLCVKRAATDTSINTLVFGAEAAMHLEEYRFFMELGDTARAEYSLRKAQETDTSGSCPLVTGGSDASGGGDEGGGSKASKGEEHSSKKWMNCPMCKARVFDDPCAKILKCWDCKGEVNFGKVKAGDGGMRGRQERRRREAEAAREVRRRERRAAQTKAGQYAVAA